MVIGQFSFMHDPGCQPCLLLQHLWLWPCLFHRRWRCLPRCLLCDGRGSDAWRVTWSSNVRLLC